MVNGESAAATAKVFKERGSRGTTLSLVAEKMGADRASLYCYVGSKDELFQDQSSSAPKKLRWLVEP